MNSIRRALVLRLIEVICIQLLCFVGIAHSAEVQLGVAPQIKLPEGLPGYSEELGHFFGTNIELLKSSYLQARVIRNHAQDLARGTADSIRLQVTQVPQTSILQLQATGPDEAVCAKYLAALAQEFLAFNVEKKKKHYEDALDRVKAAITAAKHDPSLAKALADYQYKLLLASILDTRGLFEIWPAQ